MSVKSDVEELQKINVDIKRTSDSLKKLRAAKKETEKRVADYLNKRDIPGVKHNGDVIILERKQRNIYNKPKKERNQTLLELLESSGIKNAKEVAEKIHNIGKESVSKEVIKINSI